MSVTANLSIRNNPGMKTGKEWILVCHFAGEGPYVMKSYGPRKPAPVTVRSDHDLISMTRDISRRT